MHKLKPLEDLCFEVSIIAWLKNILTKHNGRTELITTKPIFLNQNGKAVAAFGKMKHAILFLPTDCGS